MDNPELKDPSCGTCLFSRECRTGDEPDPERPTEFVYCRFSHAYTTAEDSSRALVHHYEVCGDGAWRPKDLGLERMKAEGAVGYLVARVNIDIAREEAAGRLVIPRRELVGAAGDGPLQ